MNAQLIPEKDAESKACKRKSPHGELWYKRYPSRFRKATSHLPYDLRCQYSDLLDLFYEHGGPLPDDDKWISCHLICDVRKWRPIRKALMAIGMIFIGGDGLIHNATVDEVIEERDDKLAKAGVRPKKRRLGHMAIPLRSSVGSSVGSPVGSSVGSSRDFSESASVINLSARKTCGDTRASRSKIEDLRQESKGLSNEEGSYLEEALARILAEEPAPPPRRYAYGGARP